MKQASVSSTVHGGGKRRALVMRRDYTARTLRLASWVTLPIEIRGRTRRASASSAVPAPAVAAVTRPLVVLAEFCGLLPPVLPKRLLVAYPGFLIFQ